MWVVLQLRPVIYICSIQYITCMNDFLANGMINYQQQHDNKETSKKVKESNKNSVCFLSLDFIFRCLASLFVVTDVTYLFQYSDLPNILRRCYFCSILGIHLIHSLSCSDIICFYSHELLENIYLDRTISTWDEGKRQPRLYEIEWCYCCHITGNKY